MVFKKFLDSMERGLGFGVGLLIIAAFAFGVYAFVEPTSGPSSDFYYNTESPITSNTTLEFVGYTEVLEGNLSGLKGGNEQCDSLYEGSRWMTYNDFLKIGTLYNYTYDVWLYDGIDHYSTTSYSRDFSEVIASGNPAQANCEGFTSNSGSPYRGPVIATTGSIDEEFCGNGARLACVRGQ